MEPVLIAILALLGGGGGIVAAIKAITDFRNKKASREIDADDRLVTRLEKRLNDYELRISNLEQRHEEDNSYILVLITTMSRAGVDVPVRKEKQK